MWISLEYHHPACHILSLETSLETSLDTLLNIWGHTSYPPEYNVLQSTIFHLVLNFNSQIFNKCLLQSRYNVCGITQTYQI